MSASDHLRRYFDNRRSAHAHMRNPIIKISEGVEVAPALLRNSPNDASIVSGGGPLSLRPSRCALVFSGGSHRPLATAVLARLWPPVIRAPLACSHRPSLPQRDLAAAGASHGSRENKYHSHALELHRATAYDATSYALPTD